MDKFIVSARKYRPVTFNSVIGQRHITETLKNAISRQQLAHAYLFTGPRGVGKTTCARIFAKAINCLNPTPDHEACGECESCVAFDSGRSFNIHELDAASNNSVDDIRSLNEKVRIAPQIGRYSVYIIDEVHMLSTGAFNAFLKTLEEPPHYAIFILATTDKHKVLPTILSRCQTYDFNRIRVEDTVDYLKYIAKREGVSYDNESLHIIALKADGGMRDALSIFDRVVSFCGSNLTFEKVGESIGALDMNTYFMAIEMALSENYKDLLLLFDKILRKGFEGQLFIAGLGEHVRNLLVARDPSTMSLLEASGDIAARYAAQAAACELDFLFNAINLLNLADNSYRSATNRRMHAELALIKLCSLKKKEPLTDRYPVPQIVVSSASGVTTQTTKAIDQSAGEAVTAKLAPESPRETPPSELSSRGISSGGASDQSVSTTGGSTPQLAATKATPTARRSVTGFSISALSSTTTKAPQPTTEQLAEAPSPKSETLSPQQSQRILTEGYQRLIDLWSSRQRPRIATALSQNEISGNCVKIFVPDSILEDEITQNKWQIESDIMELMGISASVVSEIREVAIVHKPVSLEQKLQYLVDLNPNILKLRDELDLTV